MHDHPWLTKFGVLTNTWCKNTLFHISASMHVHVYMHVYLLQTLLVTSRVHKNG